MIDFKILVADKIIRFKSEDPALDYCACEQREFKRFLYQGSQEADIVFEIKYAAPPVFKDKEILFNVDENWTLSRYKDKVIFEYPDRAVQGRVESLAQINEDMSEGIIYSNGERTPEQKEKLRRQRLLNMTEAEKAAPDQRRKRRKEKGLQHKKKPPKEMTPEELGRRVMATIKANFFQAFLIEYLVKQKIGFLLHCASVQHGEELYLFMGQTQAGKSTISELWHNLAGAKVFNDDRAIIRAENGTAYFYNAPWVGSLGRKCELPSENMTKIDRIFFIYHQSHNVLKRLKPTEAVAKIFRSSFPVFWQKDALGFVLEACTKIASSVPCYDLGFMPDESAVGFLKRELKL